MFLKGFPLNSTLAAQRLFERAKEVVSGSKPADNPKLEKLFRRIVADEELWFRVNETLDGHLTWAMEITSMGLRENEVAIVSAFLKENDLQRIQLSSPEAYRALVVTVLSSYRKRAKAELLKKQKEFSDLFGMTARFDVNGVVMSGYMYGQPSTTYVTDDDFYHRTYSDFYGEFQEVTAAAALKINHDSMLFKNIVSIEKRMDEIRKAWGSWRALEELEQRIGNIEKYGDTRGAF